MSEESLARAVRTAMDASGVSIRKLAEITATSPAYIARLRDGSPGTALNLGVVGQALGLAPGDLLNVYMDYVPPDGVDAGRLAQEILLLDAEKQKLVAELVRVLRGL